MIALALLLTAASLAGCGSTPTPEEKGRQAVTFFKEGCRVFQEGQIDAGIDQLRKGNETQPGYTELKFNLGRMLLFRAEREDVLNMQLQEQVKTLLSQGSTVSAPSDELGKKPAPTVNAKEEAKKKQETANDLHRRAMDDLREAQGHLLYVADVWPYEPNVTFFLAKIAIGLYDYDSARSYLKKTLELTPETGEWRQRIQRAIEILGQAELEQKRLKDGK